MEDALNKRQAYKLADYQLAGVNYVLSQFGKGSGALLTMDMGTGKTLTSISVAHRLLSEGKINRVLIVCPNSVLSVWEREIAFWYASFVNAECPSVVNIKNYKSTHRHDNLPDRGFVLVNYESVWASKKVGKKKQVTPQEWISVYSPDLVIADEVHVLGTPESNQSIAMHCLGDKTPYRIGLTGTPIQNTPLNLWSVLRFIDQRIINKPFFAFRARYAEIKQMMGKGRAYPQITGYKNLSELTSLLHSCSYRVILDEVVDMPPCRHVVMPIAMKSDDKNNYDDLRVSGFNLAREGNQAAALTTLIHLRRFLGGFVPVVNNEVEEWAYGNTAKVEAFIALCHELRDRGESFVVFCQFTAEVVFLQQFAQEAGLKAQCMYGQTSPEMRKSLVSDFQNGLIDCLICQTKVAGTGLTLTRGTVAIFYSLSFSFTEKQQALYRLWRNGQKQMVTNIYLITANSVDEYVYGKIQNKQNVSTRIVDLKEILTG
jgi:SNF2 family DNA or RNA helicase